jgi:resolvase-like protein
VQPRGRERKRYFSTKYLFSNIFLFFSRAGSGAYPLGPARGGPNATRVALMVTVLAGLAEFERELILARTSDGRAHAKARGDTLDQQ